MNISLQAKTSVLLKKTLKNKFIEKTSQHVLNLKCQGSALKVITNAIKKPNIGLWSKVLDPLPSAKLLFARKALSQVLPTAAN